MSHHASPVRGDAGIRLPNSEPKALEAELRISDGPCLGRRIGCHGGELANRAACTLTEVLPRTVQDLLDRADHSLIPRVDLTLHAAPASPASLACALTRDVAGRMRADASLEP